MTKLVFKKFGTTKGGSSGAGVTEKRVRDAEGKSLTVRTIDAQSKTFAQDLHYVFGRNVAKARRDNKAATGVVDRVPEKV